MPHFSLTASRLWLFGLSSPPTSFVSPLCQPPGHTKESPGSNTSFWAPSHTLPSIVPTQPASPAVATCPQASCCAGSATTFSFASMAHCFATPHPVSPRMSLKLRFKPFAFGPWLWLLSHTLSSTLLMHWRCLIWDYRFASAWLLSPAAASWA